MAVVTAFGGFRRWFVRGLLIVSCVYASTHALRAGGTQHPRDPSPPDPADPPAPTDPPGQEISIRGNEGIAWEQTLSSATQSQGYRFVLYVDGSGSDLSNVACQPTPIASEYTCLSSLPQLSTGSHILQLSAVVDGIESNRSNAISVSVVPDPAASDFARSRSLAVTNPSVCVDITRAECYEIEAIASLASSISVVTPTNDDRLFFVEGGRHVRVVAGRTLLPEAALTVDGATDRIIGLAIDGTFSQSRTVFLAWIEEPVAGRRTLSVARYRDVQNQFGQRSVVLSGLPLPSSADPQIAFDESHFIYVAVPSDAAAWYRTDGGSLLRFSLDGTIPWETGQVSPVLAPTYARPTAILSDPAAQLVWVAGRNNAGELELGSIASSAAVTQQRQAADGIRLYLEGNSDAAREIVSLAVQGAGLKRLQQMYLVDDNGRLSHAVPTASNATARLEPVPFFFGTPVSVVSTARGDLYVVATSEMVPRDLFTIWRLKPRSVR